ncbi:YihY/virulence factor BrkB family protein [Nocardioides marmorisolisilvae]|uniref:YihY/virulence factor BrkB family protein n=1 Tax=Nocardioides marmorisolisilvae TaxID=1542737 RepID=A0A3N0DZL9_9ACTN|nr:YihY/virulence factor BrkB family protein [Nocardioides marmorisolisilvae]RNL80933.1 YihY/virulence factor BrkB family protein [Nocardioides marmorisolisilvae]
MKTLIASAKNFLRHDDTDLAAMLTYYAVLAIFPGTLALFSLLGLIGDPDDTVKTVIDILRPLMSSDRLDSIQPTITTLVNASGATWTFALGTAGALYSASAYVGGFSRAMNRVREVEETRPFWKLRPLMLLITLASIVLLVTGLVIITVSGPLADSVGAKLGVAQSTVDRWEIAKWPALAVVVVVVVALLFHATPNVKVGRIRLLSPGAFLALLIWAGASTGFAFYVANFGSYNKTYGSVAGAIVALLWLWLTNLALLFGAEVDAVRDARIAEEKAARAAAAADLDSLDPGSYLAPPRPEPALVEKLVLRESYPVRPGEPPYGPAVQPVPEED